MQTTSREVSNGKTPRVEASPSNQVAKNQFVYAVIGMSWQLALVVILPVVAGSQLEKHFDFAPYGVIAGFSIALIGAVLVVMRNMKLVTPTETKR